ncbi:unnamed protein product [Diatraea saccharalis]|uniref:Uncharacterized protein n=1 Tax=Diatraea saccharalis TaxID=40085 RepID=A0A9N9REH8_9NEOP|nr:unnamed protein product [Diatraea saccharalis]
MLGTAFHMDEIELNRTEKLAHNQPRGISTNWWLLTIAARTVALTYLLKNGDARNMSEDQPATQDVEACASNSTRAAEANDDNQKCEEPKNGNPRILQRIETVPDIKKDTSGITTQYIATGIVNLGAFASGACIAWSSSALPLLHHIDVSKNYFPSLVNLRSRVACAPVSTCRLLRVPKLPVR